MKFLLIASLFFLALNYFQPLTLAHSQTQVIEMTPSGFQPESVTIDENSSVIFINKDKEPRWPASNVHPTHEIYPEFDPRKPINPGESWSFKAKKVGVWKYHDHLFPHQRGTITVEKEQGGEVQDEDIVEEKKGLSFVASIKEIIANILSSVKNIFKPTFANPPANKTLSTPFEFSNLTSEKQIAEITKVAEVYDGKKAWDYVKETFKGESGSTGIIHDLAHLSGGLIYEKKGFDSLSDCSSEFAFGCYHGFLDKAFKDNLDHLTDAESACLKLGQANESSSSFVSGPIASCIHGIGHGVASFYLVSDLKASLSSCRKLLAGKEYCFDGVFMEFGRNAPLSFYKKDDPLYPCNELEKEYGYAYSFACGRNQPVVLMSRFKMDFDSVVSICQSSTSKDFKNSCFDALGFNLASSGDTNHIISSCRKINETQFISRCITAAAGELVFQEAKNWQEKSVTVCSSLSEGRDECLAHIDNLIKQYGRKISKNFRELKSGEDINFYIREQIKICYDIAGKDGCYKEVATLLYKQLGLLKTLNLLKANESYPEVYARCHEVTHYLSRLEYSSQKSIPKVYSQCDSTCHGGCYHGTLEAYLKDKNLKGDKLGDEFSKVCGSESDYQKPIVFNECLHGLGHAAMFVTEMELKQSLELCDRLDQQASKERCYSGVFMENSSSSTSFDHASLYIKKDDPFYPCNSLEEKYQALCWQYQSSYFSIINNQDWAKVADLCLQIPGKYQDKCFRTIGTNQVGFTPTLQVMKKDCEMMPSDHFQNICVEGIISSFAYRFVGDVQKMEEFCSIVDQPNKESCYMQLGTALLDWDSNKDFARQTCEKLSDKQGLSWCLEAIEGKYEF